MREKDVELAFIEWLRRDPHVKFCGRQVHLPFGVLDVLSLWMNPGDCNPTVAEIKLGVVDEKALTQVMGYKAQLEHLLSVGMEVNQPFTESQMVDCGAVLVGTHMSPMVERLHNAFGVNFVKYSVEKGRIAFHEDDGHTAAILDHRPSPLLVKLSAAISAWRSDHRRRNATVFCTYENFVSLTEGRNVFGLDLNETVEYWTRGQKA